MKKPRSLPRFFHMIDGVCSRHMNTAENRNRLRHGFLHAAGYRDNTVFSHDNCPGSAQGV